VRLAPKRRTMPEWLRCFFIFSRKLGLALPRCLLCFWQFSSRFQDGRQSRLLTERLSDSRSESVPFASFSEIPHHGLTGLERA